ARAGRTFLERGGLLAPFLPQLSEDARVALLAEADEPRGFLMPSEARDLALRDADALAAVEHELYAAVRGHVSDADARFARDDDGVVPVARIDGHTREHARAGEHDGPARRKRVRGGASGRRDDDAVAAIAPHELVVHPQRVAHELPALRREHGGLVERREPPLAHLAKHAVDGLDPVLLRTEPLH